ncbi:nucleotidyltransferase family protein [Aestuariivita sp.]|jgi:CTP:molybdopterin cytidylyltransferase MocA|uniref:nucleotidyltransferase family protein n=1 Tax=Aestuariivita sp. TaxID=1872407 RepID=UPI002172C0B1|nr:nucleotidyltransferase family protein [Aestuariivita sp.]MCE8006446.1 nucleotidyltransferase family protein [Aestuariivita sp.]
MNCPVIVLAAGASSRMGGIDKLLQQVDGRPLVRRQVDMARAVADEVLVALPPRPHPRYAVLEDADVTRIEVTDASEGMNASLRAAFAALPDTASAAMLLLGDLPDVTEEDLNTVLEAVDLTSETLIWRGMTQDGKPGHPVVFRNTLFPRFAELTGDSGGQSVVAAAQGRITLIALPGTRARADLDTPRDWDRWRTENPERS